MCGRYAFYAPLARLQAQFDARIDELDAGFAPRYNAAPLQWLPVVRQRPGGERVVHLLRWGLLPAWSRDQAIATKLINARSETVAERPAFRRAFRARRCIVPASGFYEWQSRGNDKQPYFIHAGNDRLLAFAGLWERWQDETTKVLDTFTILTAPACPSLQPVHPRMPVMLQPGDYALWLDRDAEPARLQTLLASPARETLVMHEVGKAVGNVRNDHAQLIRAVDAG